MTSPMTEAKLKEIKEQLTHYVQHGSCAEYLPDLIRALLSAHDALEADNAGLLTFLRRWLDLATGYDQEFEDDTAALSAFAHEIGPLLAKDHPGDGYFKRDGDCAAKGGAGINRTRILNART